MAHNALKIMVIHALRASLFGLGPNVLTLEQGANFPYGNWPLAGILSKGQLKEKEWKTSTNQHQSVGNQEGSCKKKI